MNLYGKQQNYGKVPMKFKKENMVRIEIWEPQTNWKPTPAWYMLA